jgi:hypothetical protein
MRFVHNSRAYSAQWGENGALSARECRPSGAGAADSVKGDACMYASHRLLVSAQEYTAHIAAWIATASDAQLRAQATC